MSSTSSSRCSSTSTSSTENIVESESESSSPQVGTSTPTIWVESSALQASSSIPHRDALGDVKDEAEEKFDEDTLFTSDEKRNKMSKENIVEFLEEFPLPPPFSARVPALQEPANYGMDLETSVYEGHIRSGYRFPMHPFVVAFFNHYKMAPGQRVPNGWRKLFGLIYLVQTSGYPVTRPSGKWEFPIKWNGFCKDYEKKGFMSPNALTKKLLDHKKRRGSLSINEPLTNQEMRHAGLIPPTPAIPIPLTPVVESRVVLRSRTLELAAGTSSSRTPSLEMSGKGEGEKGDFLGLLQRAFKGKRKEVTGEGSSPTIKRSRLPAPPAPPLVACYYNNQMQSRFAMAMDVARDAETEKRAAVGKADKLSKEVDDLNVDNTELLAKVNRLEKRCEKLKKAEADVGNKAIKAFLNGTVGEEWLWKRIEDGLSIFEQGFQKAKELTVTKYPSFFLDDIIVLVFGSPSEDTAVPTKAGDVVSQGDRSVRSGNAPAP
ncbi:hypothetical protein RJ640_022751 [Escallonia rubra]|uniref:Uncharacterized protein n=1 Tax=Escallonia rubra TaxID=112253 RepID=A0AA88UU63_9ASTE|nr:hypothetical protein RJ640_022751 [Escallonia rubra]